MKKIIDAYYKFDYTIGVVFDSENSPLDVDFEKYIKESSNTLENEFLDKEKFIQFSVMDGGIGIDWLNQMSISSDTIYQMANL